MLRPSLRHHRATPALLLGTQILALTLAAFLRLWTGVIFCTFTSILFALELQPSERLASSNWSKAQGRAVWALFLTGMIAVQFALTNNLTLVLVPSPLLVWAWISVLRTLRRDGWSGK